MYLTSWHPRPPYRFDLLLDILSRYAYPPLDRAHDGAYWRALRAGDGLALLRVTGRGTADQPVLDVELMAHTGHVDVDSALTTLHTILAPDEDQTAFYAAAGAEPALWNIIQPLLGLPSARAATLFEALAQTIIEQQIAWVTAQKAQRWLVEWAGDAIEYQGKRYPVFPTPEQIAAATIDDLTPLKITFRRMALLIEVARQTASGELDLESLRLAEPQTAYQALLCIKGIGPWTVAWTLERAFGHYRVKDNDVALQAAVNLYFYGGTGRIPPQQVTQTFAPYGEFAGHAARYTISRWVLDRYPVVSDS